MTAPDLSRWEVTSTTEAALCAIAVQLGRVADALEGMQDAARDATQTNAPSDGSVAVCEGSRPAASAYPDGEGWFWYDESHQWREADLTPFLQQLEAYARRAPYPWRFAASSVPDLLSTVRTVDLSAPEEER